ncbi:uncharacterized protein EV420DRAFT_1650349 [Desarmillaria tabescens]|uniref:Uncharacterized protein n=1 Tax=Armillaria tabescens TaxID=1929756 RepID=A0AA39JDM9_ARMTA|nr:uncharacterized protein EV420DRAFT_1650349 [Desarmillaria tabescens]KAK0440860.1 hypothetical protein EV420DRAFT_1650349 [Desarmillaria tabescens]
MDPLLSQSILELIIDAISSWTDRYRSTRALTSCSLASRSLLPRSRFHLFRIIRFNDAKRFSTFQEISPQIGALIRVLDVYNDSGWVTSLSAVCAHMNNLEEIFFRKVKWGNLDLKGCQALKRAFLVDVDMTGFWAGEGADAAWENQGREHGRFPWRFEVIGC